VSAIPPIEPARPSYLVQRTRRQQQGEEHDGGRHDSEPEADGDEQDEDDEDDGLPHVDVRV
jgi:hypothetical protein